MTILELQTKSSHQLEARGTSDRRHRNFRPLAELSAAPRFEFPNFRSTAATSVARAVRTHSAEHPAAAAPWVYRALRTRRKT